MTSWIFLIISLILLLVGVGSGVRTFSWLKDAHTVQGTVIDLVETRRSSQEGSKSTFAPRIRYQMDGREREFVSSQSSSPPGFKVGESVRVATNPQKNRECIATFGELYGFSVGAAFFGMALAGTIIVIVNGDKLLRMLHPNLG